MPRLDAKRIVFSDGSEVWLRLTWGAAQRFRRATGIDLADDSMESRTKAEGMHKHFGALVHALLESKADRERLTPEDIEDMMYWADVPRILESVFAAMTPTGEGQKNGPFGNGVESGEDSASKLPMPSGVSISA